MEFEEGFKVRSGQPDGGGVVVRVNADKTAARKKVLVEKDFDFAGFVVERAEWRNRSGFYLENFKNLQKSDK